MAAAPPANPADMQAEIEQMLSVGEQVRYQLSALEEQRSMLHDVIADYERGAAALKALASGEAADDVLVPLGGGAFVQAALASGGRVLTGIGNGVHLETSAEAALKRLEEKRANADQSSARLSQEAQRLQKELATINERLQALSGQAGQG